MKYPLLHQRTLIYQVLGIEPAFMAHYAIHSPKLRMRDPVMISATGRSRDSHHHKTNSSAVENAPSSVEKPYTNEHIKSAILGIALGCLVFLLLTVSIIWALCRMRRKARFRNTCVNKRCIGIRSSRGASPMHSVRGSHRILLTFITNRFIPPP